MCDFFLFKKTWLGATLARNASIITFAAKNVMESNGGGACLGFFGQRQGTLTEGEGLREISSLWLHVM